VLILLLL